MKITNNQLLPPLVQTTAESIAKKGDSSSNTTTGAAASGVDRVNLSRSREKVEKLKTLMPQPPDSSGEKVSQIRQQLSDGSYQVASEAVAGKMLDNWRAFNVR